MCERYFKFLTDDIQFVSGGGGGGDVRRGELGINGLSKKILTLTLKQLFNRKAGIGSRQFWEML